MSDRFGSVCEGSGCDCVVWGEGIISDRAMPLGLFLGVGEPDRSSSVLSS